MATASVRQTTMDEFLRVEAAAGDELRLELVNGEIVERPMTMRSPRHTLAVTRIAQTLSNWLDAQAQLSGAVYTGDVRCRLRRNPDTLVGIDVGLWLGESSAVPPLTPPLMDGPPAVAIEVLSPSDTHEDVTEKTRLYLESGVSQVWIADPDFLTVTIHHPAAHPKFYHAEELLTADPDLPGFSVRVEFLFSGKRAVQGS